MNHHKNRLITRIMIRTASHQPVSVKKIVPFWQNTQI
ncbi:MAG: hypothetical protein MRERV_5c017 [Mycoplasmataceae bacterium RV_VA103A]|nr:MAG: hypothetical protein MRERV_5c017 [Mycoplasmataceae bacterium RV_VA103A]